MKKQSQPKKNNSNTANKKTYLIIGIATVITFAILFGSFFGLKSYNRSTRAKYKDFNLTLEQLITNMNNAKDSLPDNYVREDYLKIEDFTKDIAESGKTAPNGIKYDQYYCGLDDGFDITVRVNSENNYVSEITINFEYSSYSEKSLLAYGLQAQAAIATDSNMDFDSFLSVKDLIEKDVKEGSGDFYFSKGKNSYGKSIADNILSLYVWAGLSDFEHGQKSTVFIKPDIEPSTEPVTQPTTVAPLESTQTTEQSDIEGGAITFADALAINSDVVAWLTVPGTNITGPILQTSNNNYYLNHTIYKKYSRFGSRYADFRCNIDAQNQSQNITIYGHYSDEGVIFAKLHKYKDPEFFKSHSIIEFSTPTTFAQYKVFAVFVANTQPAQGPVFEYRDPEFATQESFLYFIERVKRRSIIYTDVDFQENDKIITLSTCTREIPESRLVVMARKVRPGEAAVVDTSKIGYAANPLYPDAWYKTKYGKGLTKPVYEDEP